MACATRSGRPKTPTASGDTRAGSTPAEWRPCRFDRSVCSSQKTLTLLRRVICHVTRALAFSNRRSDAALRLESAHTTTSPGPGVEVVVRSCFPSCSRHGARWRNTTSDPGNRPSDRAGDVVDLAERARRATPWFFRAGVRLSDWSFSPVPLTKRAARRVAAGLRHEVRRAHRLALANPRRRR